ncbi:hypothetical protein JKY72_02895 [Candidatus Gracilibacteria bacterium]|nr:hypothetical protein [Candidatus Gracilibacteria bacterium]
MHKKSITLMLGIFLLTGVFLHAGYNFWQNAISDDKLATVQEELKEVEGKLLTLQNKKVEAAVAAKRTLDDFGDIRVRWSKVLDTILETVPDNKVDILSYSGTGGDELSMSVKTTSGSVEPYFDIADLIQAFDESDDFENNFVSSIAKGISEEGAEVLTFNFSTRYIGKDVLAEARSR